MCNNNECSSCIGDVLQTILNLQTSGSPGCTDDTCTRPFLGPSPELICFNTRPISLYTCCNNTTLEFPYTLDTTTGTSSVFRIENLDDCCATCRVLAPNPDTTSDQPYVATNSFVTINLNCIGAITCLQDLYLSNV